MSVLLRALPGEAVQRPEEQQVESVPRHVGHICWKPVRSPYHIWKLRESSSKTRSIREPYSRLHLVTLLLRLCDELRLLNTPLDFGKRASRRRSFPFARANNGYGFLKGTNLTGAEKRVGRYRVGGFARRHIEPE